MNGKSSKTKGSSFERDTAARLSHWITDGARSDLFARTVLSGGKWTRSNQKGKDEGMPGDLMAAHPLAFDFLTHFLIECKHHKDILLEQYIFRGEESHLGRIISLAIKQAEANNVEPLVIAKKNHRPTLAFMRPRVLHALNAASIDLPLHHLLHSHKIAVTPFEVFLKADPKLLLDNMGIKR